MALSVAEHVTVVVPNENILPDVTTDPVDVVHDLIAMPELSTAPKFQVTAAVGVLPLVGKEVIGVLMLNGGHVNVGGVKSTLATVNVQLDTLFALLVAEQPM